MEQIRRWPLDDALVPSSSSVYKALRRLSDDGLIEPVDADRPEARDRLARTTYRATDEGVQCFEQWLRRPPATYEDLCLRIVASRSEDLPTLIEFVTSAESACLDRLQELQMPRAESLAARGAPWKAIVTVLVGRVEAAEMVGRSQMLRDLGLTLNALQQHGVAETSG